MASSAPKGPTRQVVALLVIGMLVSGCTNSLTSKFQDMQCVANCDAINPAKRRNFEQPVWQTATMFLGETFCLIAFTLLNSRLNPFRLAARQRRAAASAAAKKRASYDDSGVSLQDEPLLGADALDDSDIERRAAYADADAEVAQPEKVDWRKALLFWTPAACDILGTTCMNVGLFFVPVSIYQMLRGALVLWVGVFSVIFLKRTLTRAQWVALVVCMAGVGIVGASSLIGNGTDADGPETASEDQGVSPLVGVAFVLVAQIFTASQFVIEERIMEHHTVEPLLAAGYEGVSGLSTTMIGLFAISYLYGTRAGPYFDVQQGWHDIVDHPQVWSSSIVIAFSIAMFNFCGLAVTRTVSATARSTIDSCRVIGIWAVSLFLGWETFKPLQVVGFALLSYGAFTYNGITSFPHWTGLHRDALPAGSPPASPPFGAALGGHGPEDADVAPIGTGEQAPLLPRRE
ncbi:hypothetical protein DMC30DRAFT_414022 [Rhodotorula diobovata]|uniref:Integral membrane protein n=1 Tax=Rhodotorula diobovata TaxID=5288 RepID=A0A5C5G5E6_9BASI|nr:hypothetical protein DMC30DRAFT_414022 [Rhodotorula diobovata]